MSRPLLLAAALLALVLPGTAAAAKPKTSWADAEIRIVVARGLMAAEPETFRPDDAVTRGELAELVARLTAQEQPVLANPAAPLNMEGLNARLVHGLGLRNAAAAFAQGAKAAGLAPTSRFGTEVVARLLGLRKNHPAKQDPLERLPLDPATRAEAAYSAAQILRFRGWELERVQEAAARFALPELTAWERRILTTAFKRVGLPYIWGGTSDKAQASFGVTVPGGYDCSGFVWRVYKLQPYAGSRTLAQTLRGRTSYAMSGEVPKAKRIGLDALRPADVVFFGAKGPRSKPAEVDHMGIYVGNGWFVHSSRQGVALETLDGWYGARFAWARRPLAEAGLSSAP